MATSYVKLESAGELNRLMNEHYARAQAPAQARPVAWVSSGAPVEILRALDIFPVYPENYAAMAATRGAEPLCAAAEGAGYSRDLCSYARISLGAALLPPGLLPVQLAKPDLLLACNNICGTIVKWFAELGRIFNVPLFVLDTPFLADGPSPLTTSYVAGQLEDLIRWLEVQTGRHLQAARLAKTIELSNRAVALWREIRSYCRARPSPLNAPDLFVHMAGIVVLRGTPEAVAYYERLRDEVAARVRSGIGAIPQERYRLLWDNIAIWPRLYRFFAPFAERGACFVVDTYTGGWDMEVEPGEPIESLARAYTGIFLNRDLRYRAARLQRLLGEFACDGLVMHNNRSCKPYSLGQSVIRRLVTEATGLPALFFEGDMGDVRMYAEEQTNTRIQAFLETLEEQAR